MTHVIRDGAARRLSLLERLHRALAILFGAA